MLQFPVSHYAQEIAANEPLTRQQVVAKLKRSSTGFSRYVLFASLSDCCRLLRCVSLCLLNVSCSVVHIATVTIGTAMGRMRQVMIWSAGANQNTEV